VCRSDELKETNNMGWLTELIAHIPEILKAASVSDLSLAAFFFLVGAGLTVALMRTAPAALRLLAILIWLVASLLALLYFVHQKMPEAYVARIIGQDAEVRGSRADLDLGYVQANTPYEYRLNVRIEGDSSILEVRGFDAPLTAQIARPTADSRGNAAYGGQVLTLTLTAPVTATRQTILARLGKVQSRRGDLTLRVSYTALQSPVTVPANSGPKASGHGQDTGQTYTLCAAAPAQGDYEVVSSRYWLTGDRACNVWSWCAPAPGSARQSCFSFNMQGHSECNGGGCDATRNSEGHIEATFRLIPSTPRLTAAAG
jgi:hypothetical protein